MEFPEGGRTRRPRSSARVAHVAMFSKIEFLSQGRRRSWPSSPSSARFKVDRRRGGGPWGGLRTSSHPEAKLEDRVSPSLFPPPVPFLSYIILLSLEAG